MNHEEVPLMFQAQTEGRCQLQRVEQHKRHKAYDWKDEWTKLYPKSSQPNTSPPSPSKPDPLARYSQPKPTAKTQNNPLAEPPIFGKKVQVKESRVSWRLVSDSGQDKAIIRPIIGAKGYPYYPGSSMKGAFRNACENQEQTLKYCGGEVIKDGQKKTRPGILRFHGGYPVDISWTERLVDVVHSQGEKQVIADEKTNANVQISLYRVTLRFGISSEKLKPNDPEWLEIWKIWEKALARGLGSRVSAGYGQFDCPKPHQLLEVALKGQGLASTLLGNEQWDEKTKTPEFRPNMFKAALRGHTLRLLGGMTDEVNAKYLTKLLWGGFRENADPPGEKAIEGLLGISFEGASEKATTLHKYESDNSSQYTPIYDIERGVLRILSMHSNQTSKEQLIKLATVLIRFAMLLGGFGKSWRRIDHRRFYQDYTKENPSIGCHWEFAKGAESFYFPVNQLDDITQSIDDVRNCIRSWASDKQVKLDNNIASEWREAWHPYSNGRGVQVWGQITEDDTSNAIDWFHGEYNNTDSIYKSYLTGKLNQTGRIWHRMYPHYTGDRENWQRTGKYVELLTIFPDESNIASKFLQFLDQDTDFIKVWG